METEQTNPKWEDDSIQFPRLLAEINATQVLDMEELCESMDLDLEDIEELFERAELAWQEIKANFLSK